MEEKLIGRRVEQETLQQCMSSGKPEFIAIYGRRRVGKTFLVRQFFAQHFDFYVTGVYQGNRQEQLGVFNRALNAHSQAYFPPAANWMDAFEQLKAYLSHLNKSQVVVFFDELPWLDTPRSRFIQAFEHFWNSWGSAQSNLKLVVCGSATTWMMSKVIASRGGLHNRTTRRIHLQPFNLAETEQYLQHQRIALSRQQIVEAYMIMGGVPYYLSLMKRGLSLAQNIDQLFFAPSAELSEEYALLMRSLFQQANYYRLVTEFLAKKAKGFTRKEIVEGLKIDDGGFFSEVLQNLELCDFVRRYRPFGKAERDTVYQLCDQYTLFYLRHVKGGKAGDEHQWSHISPTPAHHAWCGYAFEQVCLQHTAQIKKALGISGVQTNVCSWRGRGAQIDLVIDRQDQVINVCDIKYALQPYVISKAYARQLHERLMLFRQQTKTRKALHLTMVTTHGIEQNINSAEVQSQVTMDDLFAP